MANASPDLPAPWGTHALPEDGELETITCGPCVLWTKRRGDEVWLAHASGNWIESEVGRTDPEASDGADWTRWPMADRPETIRLSPVFPPRIMVIKPEASFQLLPRASARIFVRVPLWVAVSVGESNGNRLTEVPTVGLSDTWWGEVNEGELAYWLPTTARRQVDSTVVGEHQAICPLDLSNRSDEKLEVEKVALRVNHLSLFLGRDHLWSDVTRVRHQGAQEGSEIEVTGRGPREAGEVRKVAEPRTSISRTLRVRTFSRLRTLSGMGGAE